MKPHALLVNPWAHDFAAFDLWARPLGLLYLAAALKKSGWSTRLVDCLDRLHPLSKAAKPRPAWPPGTGRWFRQVVPTPPALRGAPRRFARYGLPVHVFSQEIGRGPRPDLILVTSSLTYWYPGVVEAITALRRTWPGTPLVLGGIYASLCPGHARINSGADLVVAGPAEEKLAEITQDLCGIGPPAAGEDWSALWPELDLYPLLEFAPLLTSRGCPGRCPYCASRRLYPGFSRRPVESVLAEIEDRAGRLGLRHFTFFDDALLMNADRHIGPILEQVIRLGLELAFHCPNGLHAAEITPELARLMFKAGFQTIRLGLETLDEERQGVWGGKVGAGGFELALANLKAAGFDPGRIGAYILWGWPGQKLGEVLETARQVRELGARPYLAEYSPLPGTAWWNQALAASPFDPAGEPLQQNNSFFPCRPEGFSWEKAWAIKRAAMA
ncbi:MAG: radical SAM protein [Thermodesulfobacteriota bacterium]